MSSKHTRISSREFNQDSAAAKRAANQGPVFITDRGRPAHVLLTYADYQRLSGKTETIADLLASPETVDFDFDVSRNAEVMGPVDLT